MAETNTRTGRQPGGKERKEKTWRSAAEIIDWSLPCPSIFDSRAEIKENMGFRRSAPSVQILCGVWPEAWTSS